MSVLRKNASKKRGKKKGDSVLLGAMRWLALSFSFLFLTWALFAPQSAGAAGGGVHDILLGATGLAAYLLPPLMLYGLATYARSGETSGLATFALGSILSLLGCIVLLGVVGTALGRPAWGGALGSILAGWGVSGVGRFGVVFAALSSGLIGLQILFDFSWSIFLTRAWRTLSDDYRTWTRSREDLKAVVAARLPAGDAKKAEPRMAPIPTAAKTGAPVLAPRPLESAPAEAGRDLPIFEHKKPAPKKKPEPAANDEAPAAAAVEGKPYLLPPIDLLKKSTGAAQLGRPSEAEIRDAAQNLETTLKNFNLAAHISGISPGPVITRYEVTPAPGVTVNSIVARADDIALALRAQSIRMIAPIPGKAAIGIEIPNAKGATVTLREVLESEALQSERSELGFALGLSSDGDPLAADLMKMPHVLVAGATNSGKSVMVHALIASILFRMRPDQVKFLMIDPKRIELTLYDGIPHLYDPKVPPSEVAVITQAKDASRALKALVRVMEDRYERFQAYKVQNIQQYNREARKRGEREDFYVVVVIDELADLMVVARDVVEDSIQRLTQMARAVGIHMVIATQRPSVDVLTGVIKANLPSRIAMRVASKVDSKVVIDGNGAEALQGRGDALYMIPGLDPQRIQGAYVSTEEIAGLVDYLKSQAKPNYHVIDALSAASAGGDLAQFGVEPLEFTQALKLTLERRRISQDLLKSQFGSSARATNILSALEVKGFIHKPEGSNRWQIAFEKIEDYLQKNSPQALQKPGI